MRGGGMGLNSISWEQLHYQKSAV